MAPFLPVDPRVRRQSESGGAVDLLSFLQGLSPDPSILKTLFCSSDQVFGIINFSDVSAVSHDAVRLIW